jgi:membrane protease YdiL (CAAX protease family)
MPQNQPELANPPTDVRPNWRRVIIFMLIATVLSNLARFDLINLQATLQQLPSAWKIVLIVLAEGAGIGLAALWARAQYRQTLQPAVTRTVKQAQPISLLGDIAWIPLLMAALAISALTLNGVQNSFGLNPHSYALIAASMTLLYCIMEEYGWRGYLQTELAALGNWPKYLLIGACWYGWHLTFLTDASLADNVQFFALSVLGSWGLGQVADATRSVLACACLHMLIQISMFNALFRSGLSAEQKLWLIPLLLVCYVLLIKLWQRRLSERQTVQVNNPATS